MKAVQAYAAAKKKTSTVAAGFTSIQVDDVNKKIVFTLKDNSKQELNFPIPTNGKDGDKGEQGPQGEKGEDGIYPVAININASKHLIFTMSDTSVIDAGEVNVSYDDTELRRLITTVSDNVGDMNALEVTGVVSIVEALNKINNQFMKNVTYANKKLTLEYKNGIVYDIDVSSVITDTSIGELRDVLLTAPADGEVLTYDAATSKFVNKANGHTDLLYAAKKYTDDQISKSYEASAEIVSSKPSADQATEMVEYYYKNTDGNWMKTLYIGGTEVTINPGAVNLDNCLMKADVLSAFDELFAETDKVIDTAYFKEAYNKLVTNIGLKVSTADIVDNLLSELTDVPLSAAQGKALKTLIDGIAASIKTHTDNTNIHTTAAEKKANTDHIADTDIHVTKELKDKLLTTDDIANTIDSTSTNDQITSAKLVYDELLKMTNDNYIEDANNPTSYICKSNGDTLNTPYKEGATNASISLIISVARGADSWNGQISISMASNILFVRNKGNDGWSKWAKMMSETDIATTIDSSSTDKQLASAKSVYEESRRGKLIDQSVIDKYGTEIIKYPCGRWYFASSNVARQFSDIPWGEACIIDITSIHTDGNPWKHKWAYRSYVAQTIAGKGTYIRQLESRDTAGTIGYDSGWQKVCATTVPDVAKTNITLADETNYKNSINCDSFYVVKNGTCYVTLTIDCVTPASDIYIAELPPTYGVVRFSMPRVDGSMNGYILQSGSLKLSGGTANTKYYVVSFSYPVA